MTCSSGRPSSDQPPKLPVSKTFDGRLRAANRLDRAGSGEWLLLPGMLFDSSHTWWDEEGKRGTPHEGLDLRFYRTREGLVHHLDESTCIVPIFSGRVVRIIGDFLGRSVFLAHDAYVCEKGSLFTVYGHLNPSTGLHAGDLLNEEQVFGTVAGEKKGGRVPSHLHVSVMWVPEGLAAEKLDWKTIGERTEILLWDPLSVMALRYMVVAHLQASGTTPGSHRRS